MDNLSIKAHNQIEDKEEIFVKSCLDLAKVGTLTCNARHVYTWRQLYLTEATTSAHTLLICTLAAVN